MPSDWPIVRLGDVVDFLTGFPFKSADYVADAASPRLVRGDNIAQGVLRWAGVKRWPVTLSAGLETYRLQVGDVVLAMDRPWIDAGLKYAAISAPDLPALLVQRVARLRGTPRLDTGFLKYVVGCRAFTEHVLAVQTGTAVPHISGSQIKSFEFPLPSIEEQRAIAHILGSLDDKIELNRRMSGTLEAIARTTFRSWFVDFGPVRSKATCTLPGQVQNLFPDRLENVDGQEVPVGWGVERVDAIADVVYGAPYASSLFNENQTGTPLLRIRDLATENPAVWTTEVLSKGYLVRPGDIVVGMDGEFRAHIWGGSQAWLNQRVCVFKPKDGYSAAFVHNSIAAPLAHVEATETATTVIHLGKSDIERFTVVTAPPAVLSTFSGVAQPCYDKIVLNKEHSRTLAALRDTLLPKLISGELRVKQAEKAAEAVL